MTNTVPTDDRISVSYAQYLDLIDIRAMVRAALEEYDEGRTDVERVMWIRERMAALDVKR